MKVQSVKEQLINTYAKCNEKLKDYFSHLQAANSPAHNLRYTITQLCLHNFIYLRLFLCCFKELLLKKKRNKNAIFFTMYNL